jgi:hypothetical protein
VQQASVCFASFSGTGWAIFAFLTGSAVDPGALDVSMRQDDKFPDRILEPLAVRKKRQAEEGSQAMADYRRTERATCQRMAALRAERLARDDGQEV